MINFCEISDEFLLKIIDFLGHKDITEKCDMEQIIRKNKVISKKWSYYDELFVTPTEILFTHEPYPSIKIFSVEEYEKLEKIFSIPIDDNFIQNICLSYRHDFGLLEKDVQDIMKFNAKEWIRAINNNLFIKK